VTGLLGAAALRSVLERHGIRPAKALGQNFVIDPNTIRKMLDVTGTQPGDIVLEIGPGAGSLTLGLAASGGRVVAVEKDARLIPVLEETLTGLENVSVVEADAMDMDLSTLGATSLAANLPYNIAAALAIKVLETAPSIARLTVMTQREVGGRLAAPPGSKTYGRSTVMVALWGTASVAAGVSRRAFWPVPNVDSVIVRIDRSADPLHHDAESFAAIVSACFSSRRKTVRNGLASLAGGAERAGALLTSARIEPTARPEVLSPEDFARLTDAFVKSSEAG
jgi:16S rRNA (adenine1518-N6/adenine1519-N6)-dimethyltransferase